MVMLRDGLSSIPEAEPIKIVSREYCRKLPTPLDQLPSRVRMSATELVVWGWNVESLSSTGSLHLSLAVVKQQPIDIAFLFETNLTEAMDFILEDYRFVTAGISQDVPSLGRGTAAWISPRARKGFIDWRGWSDRVLELRVKTIMGPALFVGGHAPNEKYSLKEKEAFWSLVSLAMTFPKSLFRLFVGDWNCRFHTRLPEERHILGPWIFGKGPQYLEAHKHENRDAAIETLESLCMVHINSRFRKPHKFAVTYREIWTPPGILSLCKNSGSYTTLDHAATNPHHLRCIVDCTSRPEVCWHSHHFPLEVVVKLKVKRVSWELPDRKQILIPPGLTNKLPIAKTFHLKCITNEDELENFVANNNEGTANLSVFFSLLDCTVHRCAVETFGEKESNPIFKKSWLTQEAKDAGITYAQAAGSCCSTEHRSQCFKNWRRLSRRDKKNGRVRRLGNGDWKNIQWLTKKFHFGSANVKDSTGTLRRASERSDAFAEHLNLEQWPECTAELDPVLLRVPDDDPIEGLNDPFGEIETRAALQRQKSGKSHKPDYMPAEIWKLLISLPTYITYLTFLYNGCLSQEFVPEGMLVTEVIPGFKNKPPATDMGNYRYFALMVVVLKILERMIAVRLEYGVGSKLRYSFFGFRPHVSSESSILYLREVCRQLATSILDFHTTQLDFKQAFDRISRKGLRKALLRFGVTGKFLGLIFATLAARVKVSAGAGSASSKFFTQKGGLKTGSPLSPILFVIVLAWVMEAIGRVEREDYAMEYWIQLEEAVLLLREICYADDITLLSINAALSEIRVAIIQRIGPSAGLILREDKCCITSMVRENKMTRGIAKSWFARYNHTPKLPHIEYYNKKKNKMDNIPQGNTTSILGGGFFNTHNFTRREIRRRTGEILSRCNDIRDLWRGTGFSKKRKVQIANAICGSGFLYNLGTLVPVPAEFDYIHGTQTRILRQVLGLTPPWLRRVGERYSSITDWRGNLRLESWACCLMMRRFSLFKSILRLGSEHPLYKMVIQDGDAWAPEIKHMPNSVARLDRGSWLESVLVDCQLPLNFFELDFVDAETCQKEIKHLKPWRLILQRGLEFQLHASTPRDSLIYDRHYLKRSIHQLRKDGTKHNRVLPRWLPTWRYDRTEAVFEPSEPDHESFEVDMEL